MMIVARAVSSSVLSSRAEISFTDRLVEDVGVPEVTPEEPSEPLQVLLPE